MGLMQYDGITFDNVDDLIRYKKELGKKNADFEIQEQHIETKPEKLFYAKIRQKQPYRAKRQKKHYLKDFDDEIRNLYKTRLTKCGRLKRKAMRFLVRKTGYKSKSITQYAADNGYVKFAKRHTKAIDKRLVLTKSEQDFMLKNHRKMSVSEIATHLRLKPKKVYNFLYRHNKTPSSAANYMKRRKAILPKSFDQKATELAERASVPDKQFQIYPLTPESHETFKSLLLDARERGSGITYNIARANLSLIDGREWSLSLWDDVCQQIMRSSKVLGGFGIKVVYAPQDGKLSVFKA